MVPDPLTLANGVLIVYLIVVWVVPNARGLEQVFWAMLGFLYTLVAALVAAARLTSWWLM